jgi:hypothetical protein
MAEQFHYLIQNNKPNLVDYALLQKLNSVPITNRLPLFVQKAGAISFNLITDNLFISIIIISLVLFLCWCYVEKKRQDIIANKLMKQGFKNSNENDLELFKEEPDSVDISDLFKDINKDINTEITAPEENIIPTKEVNIVTVPRAGGLVPSNVQAPKVTEIMPANGNSSYMDISNFNNNSFMLL